MIFLHKQDKWIKMQEFISVGEWVREFLCLFWCETHTKGLHVRFSMSAEEDEGRQGPRAVDRRKQSTEIRERQQSEKGDY